MKSGRKFLLTLFLAAAAAQTAPAGVAWAESAGAEGKWQKGSEQGRDYWMYQDKTGEWFRGGSRTIDGKLYFFDASGRMMSGWISEDGEMLEDGGGEAYLDGAYYCGGPDEGWAVTGWKYLPVMLEDGGVDQCWFYFRSNGRKIVSSSIEEQDENGRYRYRFDENGILCESKKLGGKNTRKEQWIQRIPTASQDAYANAHGIQRWYYGLSDGSVVQDRMRTIGGQDYLFDSLGIMRTGLVAVGPGNKYAETLICTTDAADCNVDDLESYLEEYDLMYFDEQSGARQTGEIKLTSRGKTYTFLFLSSGKAAHGVRDGKLYRAGVLQKAEGEGRYEIRTVDDKEYLVNPSGQVQGSGRYKDRDGETVWLVRRENGGYCITVE